MTSLEKIDFGSGAAQLEQGLQTYFYRAGAFRDACSPNIFLILGAKGSGKKRDIQDAS